MNGLLTFENGKVKIIEMSDDATPLLKKQSSELFFFHSHEKSKEYHGFSTRICNPYIPSVNDIIITIREIKKYHFIIASKNEIVILEKINSDEIISDEISERILNEYMKYINSFPCGMPIPFQEMYNILKKINILFSINEFDY